MDRQLTITITGPRGSGKTALAGIVASCIRRFGMQLEVDTDLQGLARAREIKSILEADHENILGFNPGILIKTSHPPENEFQAPRRTSRLNTTEVL